MKYQLYIVKELKNKNEREALFKFDEFKSMVQLLYQWAQQQAQAQAQKQVSFNWARYNNVRNLFMIYVNLLSMCNTFGHTLIW